VLSDEAPRSLPAEERARVAKQLDEFTAAESSTSPSPQAEHARHRFLILMTASSAVMIPWIVLLAVTLPRRYVASHWGATWVGFDAALLSGLAATAWFAWRRGQAVVVAAIITSTLLVTDAWFDVMSAASLTDRAMSIASAVVVELPMAMVLFFVACRLLRVDGLRARSLAGETGPDVALWKLPLLGIPPRS